jgi:hypothetical protein
LVVPDLTLQNWLVSDFESLLLATGARAAGKGADPSPITTTVLTELKEAASLTALRAPANIRAARAAIIVFCMGTTSFNRTFFSLSFSFLLESTAYGDTNPDQTRPSALAANCQRA